MHGACKKYNDDGQRKGERERVMGWGGATKAEKKPKISRTGQHPPTSTQRKRGTVRTPHIKKLHRGEKGREVVDKKRQEKRHKISPDGIYKRQTTGKDG